MKRVLVVGDIIVDRYTRVTTSRRAQEADIPVYDVEVDEPSRMGGAANVAMNLKALCGDDVMVELSGIMKASETWQLTCGEINLVCCVFGDQLEKYRLVLGSSIVVRVDNKKKFDEVYSHQFHKRFCDEICLEEYDLVIVSDYDKGSIDEALARHVMESGVPVVVDSKRYDLRIFEDAMCLNVNEEEYSRQVSNKDYMNVEALFDYVLVTLGDRGADLRQCEKLKSDGGSYTVHVEHFPTAEVPVVDVTGCGDTHTAAFALGILMDPLDVRNAVRYANECASLAVCQFGTTRISKWDFSKNLQE